MKVAQRATELSVCTGLVAGEHFPRRRRGKQLFTGRYRVLGGVYPHGGGPRECPGTGIPEVPRVWVHLEVAKVWPPIAGLTGTGNPKSGQASTVAGLVATSREAGMGPRR